MPSAMALTATGPWCGSFTLPATGSQPYRPFTFVGGKLCLAGTEIPCSYPISRIRFRAPNATTNTATVLYGDANRQTNPLPATATGLAGGGCAVELVQDPTAFRFKGTENDVVEVDVYP